MHRYRTCGILLLALGLAAHIQGKDEPAQLLAKVRRRVMDSVAALPRYVCTQTLTRFRYDRDTTHRRVDSKPRRRSCADIVADVRSRASTFGPSSSERIRLDVAVSRDAFGVDGEMYSWVGASRFRGRDLFDRLAAVGVMSTGTLSSMLASLLDGGATDMSYLGEDPAGGRLLYEFGFRVPASESAYSYAFGQRKNQQVKIAYHGRLLIDPATSDPVRLSLRSDTLPQETGACQVTREVAFDRIQLHGSDFLLPRELTVTIIHTDETVAKNVISYSDCREFQGVSEIRFASVPLVGRMESAGEPSLDLPPGLHFRLAFVDPIDPAIAAAGDPLRARVISPIRDRSGVLVPEGASVTARILGVTRYYPRSAPGWAEEAERSEDPSLVMAVKLESLETGGVTYSFRAAFDGRLQRFTKVAGNLWLRVEAGSLDRPLESDTAIFEFSDNDPGRVVGSGLESDWQTLAP